MTTWNAAPMPELGLELVRDVDRERIRSRLPRWDPRLWGDAQFSKNTRPGNRLLKLGLAWGRERVKARKLQQENVTPTSDVAPVSRFTGKEEDVEVGLQYFGKRYLSPYLGRWISADPLAVHSPGSADLNLYAYVHGAVLKAIDPFGLEDDDGGSARFAISRLIKFSPGTGIDDGSGPASGARGLLGRALRQVDTIHRVDLQEAQAFFRRTGQQVTKGGWVDATRTLKVRFDAYSSLAVGEREGPMNYETFRTTQMFAHELYHAYQQRAFYPTAAGQGALQRGIEHYQASGYSAGDARTIYGEAMADAFGIRVAAYADAVRQLNNEKASKDGLTQGELAQIKTTFENRTSQMSFGYRYEGNQQNLVAEPISAEMKQQVINESGIQDSFMGNPALRSAARAASGGSSEKKK
jgi:RHS repeat-associated protein